MIRPAASAAGARRVHCIKLYFTSLRRITGCARSVRLRGRSAPIIAFAARTLPIVLPGDASLRYISRRIATPAAGPLLSLESQFGLYGKPTRFPGNVGPDGRHSMDVAGHRRNCHRDCRNLHGLQDTAANTCRASGTISGQKADTQATRAAVIASARRIPGGSLLAMAVSTMATIPRRNIAVNGRSTQSSCTPGGLSGGTRWKHRLTQTWNWITLARF